MGQVPYTQVGSKETNELTKNRGYTRDNSWHKIRLVNIEISDMGNGLTRLTATTKGKSCPCGFHCTPQAVYLDYMDDNKPSHPSLPAHSSVVKD